jgi:uncharacterized protein (DUF2336 family)
MRAHQTLIDELEGTVACGDIGRRANVLQRVTDLFLANSGQLSKEQIGVFDDIMMRLLKEVDIKARVAFGQVVAEMETVPPQAVEELALDDCIDIAGPILRQVDQVSDDVLVKSAKTKSQDHLLAISRRRELLECVTDVLVERGGQQVAVSTTENAGARLSEFGYATLVQRAEADGVLAASIWRRPEIPRKHLLALFASASRAVQHELQLIDGGKADEIKSLVARARDELQARSSEHSSQHLAAIAYVESLWKSGNLSESDVWAFARAGELSETAVALSLMCDIPVSLVERAMTHDQCDQLLVLAKSVGLSFDTVKAILAMRMGPTDRLGSDLREASLSYGKLRAKTAKTTLQFYRLRARTI